MEFEQKEFSNIAPSLASRSILGVGAISASGPPYAESDFNAWSSENRKRIFGRSAANAEPANALKSVMKDSDFFMGMRGVLVAENWSHKERAYASSEIFLLKILGASVFLRASWRVRIYPISALLWIWA